MPRNYRTKGVNQESLSYVVGEVLELPRQRRAGKAYKITKAFTQAMINLAKTGEDIQIEGFGIFRWVIRPAMGRVTTYFYDPKSPVHIPTTIPPKCYLSFQPSKVLKRLVKESTDVSTD